MSCSLAKRFFMRGIMSLMKKLLTSGWGEQRRAGHMKPIVHKKHMTKNLNKSDR
ncbi:hypothetical protein OHZ00_08040 [Serratia marcescens]|uniref:hypothetical protein n=1 Tax=Serratia marcescens TaxID=615 RepID=UPI000A72B43F|nr:hypothetical protein [Serratia marcescens]UYU11768.1 hypothetical protein OHZ00_08040 [Serratia marcescens]